MEDHDGHDLQLGDIVTPDNLSDMQLRIDSFDGTIAYCLFRSAAGGPPLKYLPAHLVFVERP